MDKDPTFINNLLTSPFWSFLSAFLGLATLIFRHKWRASAKAAEKYTFLFNNYKLVGELEKTSDHLATQLCSQAKFVITTKVLDPIKINDIRVLISKIMRFEIILSCLEIDSIESIETIIKNPKPDFDALNDHLIKLSGNLKKERMYHHDYYFATKKTTNFKANYTD